MSEKSKINYITISEGWDGLPVAYHLALEGQDSIIGQVQDNKELKTDAGKEDPEDKENRLAQYNGMIKKYPARKVVDALKKAKNKDDYFIFCDQNDLFVYAEELLEAGFTKGLFPTKADFDFEKGREAAMEFVEANYAKIKIIPHHKVKTADEAKKILEENDVPFVIQSEGDFVSTICPVDDVEQNHIEIINALDKYAKDYAKGEIILKEKLIQPVEITPQIVFWDGKPVFTDVDIETKNIGDGENNGNQVGCGSNLIIATEFDDPINEIAFPPIVYAMAKKRKGIFVWDISLYMTEKGIYFGEFCSNRFGYDALMTEMDMAGGASKYFEALMEGKNPLKKKFGAAVRVFNLNRSKDQPITVENDPCTWLYEVKKENDKLLSLGDCWDLGVITASADTVDEAVDLLYKNIEKLSFKEKYIRSKQDFLADYPTSIMHRFIVANHIAFESPDLNGVEEQNDTYNKKLKHAVEAVNDHYNELMKEKDKEHQTEVEAIREEIKSILNA